MSGIASMSMAVRTRRAAPARRRSQAINAPESSLQEQPITARTSDYVKLLARFYFNSLISRATLDSLNGFRKGDIRGLSVERSLAGFYRRY